MAGIKISGKGGAGGAEGGGGAGESKFERLWHQVLRNPNPSTIRTFKELFSVADPSQTLFPNGNTAGTGTKANSPQNQMHRALLQHVQKLQSAVQQSSHSRSGAVRVARAYGNTQRLAGLATHLGIPTEDTFNSLRQKVGGSYREWMGAHQSSVRGGAAQSATTQEIQQTRIARKQQEAEQRANIRLNKDHSAAIRIQQGQESKSTKEKDRQARIAHKLQESQGRDRAKQARIQQAQEDRAFNASPAGIAAKYRNGLATSAIGGAEGAIATGSVSEFRKHYRTMGKLEKSAEKQVSLLSSISGTDSKELQLAQQHLAQTKSAKSRYEQMGTARWGRRATTGAGGKMGGLLAGEGIAELLGPEAVGAALGIGAIGAAAKGVYSGPSMINNFASSLMAGQKPYMDYMLNSSRLAGQFGMSGTSLRGAVFNPGAKMRSWMIREGVTGPDALKLLGAGGTPVTSANATSTLKALRGAQLSPYLRGLSDSELGSIRSTGTLAGVTTGTGSNLTQYLDKFSVAVAKGTEVGVNRATVLRGITSSLSTLAAHGAMIGGGGIGGVTSLYTKMMMGGMPGARSGQMQASFMGNLSSATRNMTSSPSRMTYMMQYMQHMNGGHMPTTAAQFGKIFGKKTLAGINASSGEKHILDSGLRAIRSGNVYGGMLQLDKVMPAADTLKMAQWVASTMPSGTGMKLPLIAGLTTGTISQTASATYRRIHKSVAVSFGNSQMNYVHTPQGAVGVYAHGSNWRKNNNPGDVMMPGTGLYNSYKTMGAGYRAMAHSIHSYGLDTVAGIVRKYTGASSASEIKNISHSLGVGGNQKINLNSKAEMAKLVAQMAIWEQKHVHPGTLTGRVRGYLDHPGDASLLAPSSVSRARMLHYHQLVGSSIAGIKAAKEKTGLSAPTVKTLQSLSEWTSKVESSTQSVLGFGSHLDHTIPAIEAFHKSLTKATKSVHSKSHPLLGPDGGLRVH
jgi:hypothetical protein